MYKVAGNRDRVEKQHFKSTKKPTVIKEHIIVDRDGHDVGVLYPYRDSWILSIYDQKPMIFDGYHQAIRYLKENSSEF